MLDLPLHRELEYSTWRREYVSKWTFRERLNPDDPYYDEKSSERESSRFMMHTRVDMDVTRGFYS